MSVADFLTTQFATFLEEESIRLISRGMDNNTISMVANNADGYFQMLAKLPISGNRVAWSRIDNLSLHPPEGYAGSQQHRVIGYGTQQKELMQSLGIYFGIQHEQGFLFEDHFGDCVLNLSYADFCRLDTEFFYTPGHKYLLASNNSWLLNITMEGDLYFSNRISHYF